MVLGLVVDDATLHGRISSLHILCSPRSANPSGRSSMTPCARAHQRRFASEAWICSFVWRTAVPVRPPRVCVMVRWLERGRIGVVDRRRTWNVLVPMILGVLGHVDLFGDANGEKVCEALSDNPLPGVSDRRPCDQERWTRLADQALESGGLRADRRVSPMGFGENPMSALPRPSLSLALGQNHPSPDSSSRAADQGSLRLRLQGIAGSR